MKINPQRGYSGVVSARRRLIKLGDIASIDGRRTDFMITIEAEQEHYCLVTDGGCWTVVERRAGRYYPLGDCARPGVALDAPEAASLFHGHGHAEADARRILAGVATEWRNLFEIIR
jgi:hypothetical protein